MNTNFQAGQVMANQNALSSADQFNQLASARPQPAPSQQPSNFNPSNVFAAMKNNKGVLDSSAAPQGAGASSPSLAPSLAPPLRALEICLTDHPFTAPLSNRQVRRPPTSGDGLPGHDAAAADDWVPSATAAAHGRLHAEPADRSVSLSRLQLSHKVRS